MERTPQKKTPIGGKLLLAKEEFSRHCNLLYTRHLVAGVGGNLSARVGKQVLLTPTGSSLRDIEPQYVVISDIGGNVIGSGIPTKDAEMHLGILRCREDIHVVCHVHGAYLVALSAIVAPGEDVLPPITPGFTYLAHPLAMVPFMIPGSRELTDAAVEHFRGGRRYSLLLQNHGLITAGKDFSNAINVAEEIEEAARVYVLTEGKARRIPAKDVGRIKDLP